MACVLAGLSNPFLSSCQSSSWPCSHLAVSDRSPACRWPLCKRCLLHAFSPTYESTPRTHTYTHTPTYTLPCSHLAASGQSPAAIWTSVERAIVRTLLVAEPQFAQHFDADLSTDCPQVCEFTLTPTSAQTAHGCVCVPFDASRNTGKSCLRGRCVAGLLWVYLSCLVAGTSAVLPAPRRRCYLGRGPQRICDRNQRPTFHAAHWSVAVSCRRRVHPCYPCHELVRKTVPNTSPVTGPFHSSCVRSNARFPFVLRALFDCKAVYTRTFRVTPAMHPSVDACDTLALLGRSCIPLSNLITRLPPPHHRLFNPLQRSRGQPSMRTCCTRRRSST